MSLETKILIVEDEVLIADYLMELLQEEGFTNIRMAHDREGALDAMETFIPDIILMDINLHGKNSGIELVQFKYEHTKVLFLTGQSDVGLMTKALETNPDGYLTKPIKKNDLLAAVKLLIFKQQLRCITVKHGYNTIKINLDEVLFVKSENNYIDIQLAHKKYSIRQSLEGFIKENNIEQLVRIHRSYIVNISKITQKKTHTIMINDFEIPCSRGADLTL